MQYVITEPSYPAITSCEYCNTAEAQGKHLKPNLMKIIEVLKGEMNKSLKESKEKANQNKN